MHKNFKITLIISFILSLIIILILLLVKYEKYTDCLVLNYQNEKYLIVTKQNYQKLHDKKNLKIQKNQMNYNIKINQWIENSDYAYSMFDISNFNESGNFKLFIKSTNIFGF